MYYLTILDITTIAGDNNLYMLDVDEKPNTTLVYKVRAFSKYDRTDYHHNLTGTVNIPAYRSL